MIGWFAEVLSELTYGVKIDRATVQVIGMTTDNTSQRAPSRADSPAICNAVFALKKTKLA